MFAEAFELCWYWLQRLFPPKSVLAKDALEDISLFKAHEKEKRCVSFGMEKKKKKEMLLLKNPGVFFRVAYRHYDS